MRVQRLLLRRQKFEGGCYVSVKLFSQVTPCSSFKFLRSMSATFSTTPPVRWSSNASTRVYVARCQVGEHDSKDWQRAVSIRDPVSRLKRTHAHVNRATFKMHEIVSRLFAGDDMAPPRNAVFLARSSRRISILCSQSLAKLQLPCNVVICPQVIKFANEDDAAIMKDLPNDADLRNAAVEAVIVERCGAAAIEFVSADGGTSVDDLNAAEQHSTALAIAQASTALTIQSKGGSMVLKVFEGCTLATRQLFEILRNLYQKIIMLFKPLSSKKFAIASDTSSAST